MTPINTIITHEDGGKFRVFEAGRGFCVLSLDNDGNERRNAPGLIDVETPLGPFPTYADAVEAVLG